MSKFLRFLTSLTAFLFIFSISAYSQSGKLIGTVVDKDFGDALIGANVFIEGTTIGAATDIEGRYSISNVPVGTYSITFSMVGFTKQVVKDVVVSANGVTKIDIALGTEAIETEEVVITAKAVKDSEAGLLIKRQKSISVSDAISAEQISRSGSGDAAEAVKQIVGASVVDGKYVYVRGLGERYSSTQLNGAELPSSDPNKKAFQLDLLPTSLLENITTIKTFTPDKPGNFSGGIVDIGTKSFPDKFTFKLGGSGSYNSIASMNDNFVTYTGGETDWLGFDDGYRDMPSMLSDPNLIISSGTAIQARTNPELAQFLDDASNSFNRTMGTYREAVPVNQSFSVAIGDEIKTGENSSFGYLGSLSYSRSFSLYEGAEIGRYSLPDAESGEELNLELGLTEDRSSIEANLGGLFSFAYNFSSQHQIGGNVFYSNSGNSEARYQTGKWPHQLGIDDPRVVKNSVLKYVQRDIISYQLRGNHHFKSLFEATVDWSASFAKTSQDEPDLRFMFYYYDPETNSNYNAIGSNFDKPTRYFRFLEDETNTFNINLTFPFNTGEGLNSKFKTGFYYQKKLRNFNERLFSYSLSNSVNNLLDELDEENGDEDIDINEFFERMTLGISNYDSLRGRYSFDNYITVSNSDGNYHGLEEVVSVYQMVELQVLQNLRFIGGVRFESTLMKATPYLISDTQKEGKIGEIDVLPSINFIYSISPTMNIRLAATQTLARPNFREIAPFSDKEFINGRTLIGNPNLERTLIQNYDIRWEWFMRPGEISAVSLFYKKMEDPIEIGFAEGSTKANQIVTYSNVPNAEIMGIEIEGRLRLDYIADILDDFYFGGNFSLISATIDIPFSELSERRKLDPASDDIRDLQGQSQYIVNLDLGYNNIETETSINLHFNIFGERLSIVSGGADPDVYEQPQPQLDLTFSQPLLSNFTIKGGVKNILNSEHNEVYRFKDTEYTYYKYQKGISFSLGLSYSL